MNQYLTALYDHLQSCQQRGGFSGMGSVLEFLWECYSADKPVDDGQIRLHEEALYPIMQALPYDLANTLFDHITDLCTAYQRAAFLEGLTLGARLHAELSTAP